MVGIILTWKFGIYNMYKRFLKVVIEGLGIFEEAKVSCTTAEGLFQAVSTSFTLNVVSSFSDTCGMISTR